jgi:hypothetical protein
MLVHEKPLLPSLIVLIRCSQLGYAPRVALKKLSLPATNTLAYILLFISRKVEMFQKFKTRDRNEFSYL